MSCAEKKVTEVPESWLSGAPETFYSMWRMPQARCSEAESSFAADSPRRVPGAQPTCYHSIPVPANPPIFSTLIVPDPVLFPALVVLPVPALLPAPAPPPVPEPPLPPVPEPEPAPLPPPGP